MILQALASYYERLQGDGLLCEDGYMLKSVPYQLIISPEGDLMAVFPLEQKEGKRKLTPEKTIPIIPDRSGKAGYKKVGFVVDKADYLLGIRMGADKEKYATAYRERIEACWKATRHPNVNALLKFMDCLQSQKDLPELSIILGHKPGSPILDLRISGQANSLWDVPELRDWYTSQQQLACSAEDDGNDKEGNSISSSAGVVGQCLVTGHKNVTIEKVHGLLTAGLVSDNNAALVSFNKAAFESYGWKQGCNAPVSVDGRKAYMGALKHIFGKESKQKLRLADSVAGFWAETETQFEVDILSFFGSDTGESTDTVTSPENGEKKEMDAVKAAQSVWLTARYGGKVPDLSPYLNEGTRFYVLGLAPNVARLSVRFWYSGSVATLAHNIQQHFDDLAIIPNYADPPFLSLNRLVAATCIKDELKNANPRLAGELMQAALKGTPYPQSILPAVVNRMKAAQNVNYQKAALLKAVLNRYRRFYPQTALYQPLEETMDPNNQNIGYRLGRWFATLERLQEAAQGSGVNSTIRDRFFSSAMSTPLVVFSRLEKLSKAHLGKLSGGLSHWYLSQLQEILTSVDTVPTQLTLTDQAQFALGYYHQRQHLFAKKAAEPVGETEPSPAL